MFWNFYDELGMCVWTEPAMSGDTLSSMKHWWDWFIKDEEYNPGVAEISMEEFDGLQMEHA